MSFILDALKKSEMERQRQAMPGLMEAGAARKPRGFPLWAIALSALLAVNLLVLCFVLSRRAPGSTAAPEPRAAVAAAPGAAVSAAVASQHAPSAPFSPMDAAPPVYAPEIPADAPAAEGRGAEGAGAGAGAGAALPPAASSLRPARSYDAAPALDDADAKAQEEVLPSISEVNVSDPSLADLHLDVHVYATRPADRFVYINMRKYREGATLAEGPTLERIRRDGVVLDFHGLRFLLPRQQ